MGHEEETRRFVEAAFDGDLEGVTGHIDLVSPVARAVALQGAAQNGHLEVMKALIKFGVDVNYQDRSVGNGATSLILAAFAGKQEAVDLLIENGADVNLQNNQGLGAAFYAYGNKLRNIPEWWEAVKGDLAGVRAFVERKVDINMRNAFGGTALHLAVRRGDSAMVGFLVSQGADINAQTIDGETPLMCSCQDTGSPQIARILVKHGADRHLQDKKGRTALEMAKAGGNAKLLKQLRPRRFWSF